MDPKLSDEKAVLLFFKDFEKDSLLPYDRYVKRLVRPVYGRLRHRPTTTGFSVWFQRLVKALVREGYKVRVNDYRTARRNPSYPVGLVGYPHLLDDWTLPNPAILGPSLFDHPLDRPKLLDDPRFRLYIVTCEWMRRMFEPVYGDRCVSWYAGVDLGEWHDTRYHPKEYDVLIYDKIRWNREEYDRKLLQPIVSLLSARGLRHTVIAYRRYDYHLYRKLLAKSKAMLFLCEHETQGMAYQEALACNVPVLAWDNGYWLDPKRPDYDPNPVPATSVPHFSPECGDRFRDYAEFPRRFEEFWSRLESYQPRRFVERELSLSGSARVYLDYYWQLVDQG